MRVLVVPKWYPWPDRPVFGIFCREQALALAQEHDVIVLASDPVRFPSFRAFELTDATEDGSLRTLRLRYRRPRFRPAAMFFQLAGMLVALKRLRREGWRPQIVHAHVYSAGLPALVLGRLSRAPVVVSEHYTGFQRGLVRGYDRLTAILAFRGADLVAPVSGDLARQIRALAPRSRIEVVGNVVDTEVFHPRADATPDAGNAVAHLLTVAALTEKKGHRFLLEAVASLRTARPIELDLVGDGELRGELEAHARSLGVADVVRFHGELAKEEVAGLMRSVDLFVLPSLFENHPCVLIEAMASGLPSVATAVGGVPELLGERGGTLCRAGDSDALANAIAAALDRLSAVNRPALAREARERFGREAFRQRWTGLYGELLAGAPPTSPAADTSSNADTGSRGSHRP